MFEHTLYSRQVTIQAPRDWVWSILVDTQRYGEWNPFTWRVDTTLKVGDPVDLHVRMPKRGDRMQTENVTRVDKPTCLAWGMTMGAAPILKAERQQTLTALSEVSCRYQTWDAFSGLLTPVVTYFFEEDIVNGFNAMADALKIRAETTWQASGMQMTTT